jgi:hypothetical protein
MYNVWAGKEALKPAFQALFGDNDEDGWWSNYRHFQHAIDTVPLGIPTSPICDEEIQRTLRKNEVVVIRKNTKEVC